MSCPKGFKDLVEERRKKKERRKKTIQTKSLASTSV